MERHERLKACLERAFEPSHLTITDDGHAHAGHRHQGGGHFSVTICSSHFEGRSLIERHRMVYRAVGGLMPQDIHALGIKALTPAEKAG